MDHPAFDHPIFTESIRRIRAALADAGAPEAWRQAARRCAAPAERDVLERCVHSSGDPAIAPDLVFAPPASAAAQGMEALAAGAVILTDTAMAAAAVAPMARRTFANRVRCLLDWAPAQATPGQTRSAAAVAAAWRELTAGAGPQVPAPVVLIGSAPTALERLLDLLEPNPAPGRDAAAPRAQAPSLLIGMPVGFVGVAESKRRLAASGLAQIRLEGSRGGAALVAAACNALLRAAWLQAARSPPAPGPFP